MKIICAWCGKVQGDPTSEDTSRMTSHGICPTCAKKFFISKMELPQNDPLYQKALISF